MARKMLSINSNRSMNYLLKTTIRSSYDVVTAEDAFEAMSALKNPGDIECILIDLDFQTSQNLSFILHLKDSFLYQCPVIALSSNKEIYKNNKPSIVESIFYKPFDPLDLKRAIDEIMMGSLQK